jgi:hypothetical protein
MKWHLQNEEQQSDKRYLTSLDRTPKKTDAETGNGGGVISLRARWREGEKEKEETERPQEKGEKNI